MVRFHRPVQVGAVDADGHPHQHVLGPLDDGPVDAQQVGPLQRLEAEVVVVEVAHVDDFRVQAVGVGCDRGRQLGRHERRLLARLGVDVRRHQLDRLGERLQRVLVQVGDRDAGGELEKGGEGEGGRGGDAREAGGMRGKGERGREVRERGAARAPPPPPPSLLLSPVLRPLAPILSPPLQAYHRVVRVGGRHGGRRLSCQLVQLGRRHALVDAGRDLLGDQDLRIGEGERGGEGV